MDALIPKMPEILVALTSFLVLFAILSKFAFPPVTKMLDERAEKIRESLEKAEETRIEAERLLEEYRVQMAEARAEAGKVIEQGRTVAENMKNEIVAKAREEAEAEKTKEARRYGRVAGVCGQPIGCRRRQDHRPAALCGRSCGAHRAFHRRGGKPA
jgi:F0F1-type ATP synthase membrane subunit b/b'